MSARRKRRHPRRKQTRIRESLVFHRRNYVLLVVGVLMVLLGFAIMRVENALDGFLSLYVAPLIILGGYLEIIYAILWRPSSEEAPEEARTSA